MDNEILRVNGNEKINNEEVNVSSFGNDKKKIDKIKQNSFYNFLTDELNEKQFKNESEVTCVEKPKLFDSIALAVLLGIATLTLSLLCLFTGELVFVPFLILIAGVTIPLSITYFCFRLNTHNDVTFLNIVKYAFAGAIISVVVNFIFKSLSTSIFGSSISFSLIKSIIEIVSVLIALSICIVNNKCANYTSVLLIASSISAGFIITDTVTELFYSLFISMDVSDGNITKSLGAIINSDKYVKSSVKNIVYSVFKSSVFRSTVFMVSMILNGFAIRFVSVKNTTSNINSLTGGLLFPLAIIIYVLSEFLSSISLLQIVYNIVAFLIAIVVFYKVVDYCIKIEKYI